MLVRVADLFCGAGGTSTGAVRACARLGRAIDLLAVNHWPEAIATHKLNHPGIRHLCEDLGAIDPRRAVPEAKLDLLLASPECTSHSYSRGGRPISEQSRASAWHPLRWADQLRVGALIIENVPQFRDWGPTDRRGRPIPSRKGETYRQYLTMLEAMGYTVGARVLNAADYGAATTRRRLFILAQKGGRRIRWPEPTHAPAGMLLPERRPWRAAKEIIDWSLVGQSIFARKRRLSRATEERILMGLAKFGGPELLPWLVVLRQHMGSQSLSEPVPTLTAGGQHIGLAEAFMVSVNHGVKGKHGDGAHRVSSVNGPLRTITAQRRGEALVEPFLVRFDHGYGQQSGVVRGVDAPLPTLTTKNGMAVVEPFLVGSGGAWDNRPQSLDEPVRAIMSRESKALVEPVITDGKDAEPVGQPFIVPFNGERAGQAPRTHSIEEPLPTVMSGGAGARALVEPFLMKYSRTGGARATAEPLDTLTTKPRYGLVTAQGIEIARGLYLDIRFRMLRPHELAAAMGFPTGYQFTGKIAAQVKQIGNAVEVHQAEALCFAMLA